MRNNIAVEIPAHANRALEDIFVTYDDQSGYPLNEDDIVQMRKSERLRHLVKAPARNYFKVMREKLKTLAPSAKPWLESS